jgi:hypothetical protein
MERTRKLGAEELLYDCKRSLKLCLGAQGRKAKAKSRDEDGEQGVTMIAGRGDLPATSSKERSMSVISLDMGFGRWEMN